MFFLYKYFTTNQQKYWLIRKKNRYIKNFVKLPTVSSGGKNSGSNFQLVFVGSPHKRLIPRIVFGHRGQSLVSKFLLKNDINITSSFINPLHNLQKKILNLQYKYISSNKKLESEICRRTPFFFWSSSAVPLGAVHKLCRLGRGEGVENCRCYFSKKTIKWGRWSKIVDYETT